MAFKKPFKVLVGFFFIGFICFMALCAYVLTNGRGIILRELEKKLGVKPEISSLRVVFPAAIVVEDFVIGDSVRINKITIVPSLLGFLRGDIILNSCVLDKPYLKITRKADETMDFGFIAFKKEDRSSASALQLQSSGEKDASVSLEQPLPAEKAKQKRNFYLKNLKVNNAVVDFIDESVVLGGVFRIRLDHLNLNVSQASFLEPTRMQINAAGVFVSQQGVSIGGINILGWFDYPHRDMDIKGYLKNIRLPYLAPYFLKFAKKELEAGNMEMSVNLKSVKNDLRMDSHVELDHLAFKNEGNPSSDNNKLSVGDFMSMAFNSVLSVQGKVIFDFSVETKMDRPKFENVRFKGRFLENGMKAVISKGPEVATNLATGSVKETIEDFKKVGKQFEDIGKQFKDMFKK